MSAIVKPKLKAARDALQKKDYAKAKDASLNVLDFEPDNYTAIVFLGKAYLELKDTRESERVIEVIRKAGFDPSDLRLRSQMYLKACLLQPDSSLAFQGLAKLYEQTEEWDKFVDVLQKLAQTFLKSNDAPKCAESLQRLIECLKLRGTPMERVSYLSLLLPGSEYYSLLSGLPSPDATNPDATTTFDVQSAIHNSLPILEEMVDIVENHDSERFAKEVAKRRTRLGAGGPEAVKREVGKEIWGSSRLPELYQEIMNHPNASDELRRSTEAKLLQHKQLLLYALSSTSDMAQKIRISAEVQEFVSGIVLLNIPNQLAWSLFIEGTDASAVDDYDIDILFRYVRLFPETPLAKLLKAYFAYTEISDVGSEEDKDRVDDGDNDEDYAAVIMDIFPSLSNSILAHRITAEVYQDEEDLENAVKTAENGLELLSREERSRAIKLNRVRQAFNVVLSTALVHLFPPKHHIRALRIIDEVLAEDKENVPCLMGRAYILEKAKRWEDAQALFEKVAQLLPDDLNEGLRAREESAWCQGQVHDPYGGCRELQAVLNIIDVQDGRDVDKARCWWRLGKCQWSLGDDASREEAYRSFITSLKRFGSFAPAFTSLGIYYSEFLSPPDPNRASKCFQKAFELDPREAEAARRLAEGFAEEREWDLVEVVAKRTIEGEGGLDGGLEATAASRFHPVNAWAWKALGIVELTRHRYAAAISALQVALRSEPEDALSWLRLGEAYSRSTRLAAALKALERARELDPDDWKCSYFLGEVHRQSGQFQQAIDTFTGILSGMPSELTVLLALAQAHLDFGRANKAANFTSRAEHSYLTAIGIVLDGLDASPGFRRIAWKIAADAFLELTGFGSYIQSRELARLLGRALPLVTAHPLTRLSAFLDASVPPIHFLQPALSRVALEVAIYAYSSRISLGSLDDMVAASASYDLGVALRMYAQRSTDEAKKDKANAEAIHCFKEAISLAPLEDRYWGALADAYFIERPRLAQHAFIKALELDSKNFVTWTSLGLFYAYHGDVDVAREAFNKAQVLDPDYSLAWVGQAVIATSCDKHKEASALFEHAVTLASSTPEADLAFAQRALEQINTSLTKQPTPSDSLFPAFFVMDRYVKQRPQNATALHIFGLVCERIGQFELGISTIAEAAALLEAAYEGTEDPAIERQFTIAQINMARLRIATAAYADAIDAYQVAIGLLSEPGDERSVALLAQAYLGSGLANIYLGDTQEALTSFEAALEVAANDTRLRSHAIVLLAQTLWSLDTDEGREAAKAQLLQSIDSDPDNLMAINTLAGMGILTEDDSLLDAALSEILALPVEDRQERDPDRDVTYLLTKHHLAQGNLHHALAVAQKAVVLEPSRCKSRKDLAALSLQRGDPVSAQAVLRPSGAHMELREILGLQAIAEARVQAESAKSHAAKAVFLTPWDRRSWQALAYCCSVR